MKEGETIFKVGNITTCKRCGHRIIKLQRGRFHIKSYKSLGGDKLVHTEDGQLQFVAELMDVTVLMHSQ